MRFKNYVCNDPMIMDIAKRYKLKGLGGKNDFENKYTALRWSAPIIQQPKALEEYMYALGIIGATITGIDTVDCVYELAEGLHVSCLYPKHNIKGTDENGNYIYEECDRESTMEWLQKEKFKLGIEIDMPFIIYTDKGQYEIDYSESSTVMMDKDKIPAKVINSTHGQLIYFLPSKIFEAAVGHKIVDIKIGECSYWDADADFTGSHGISLDSEQDRFIKGLELILDNGYRLHCYSWYDWGYVELLNDKGEPVEVPGEEIEQYLALPIGTDIDEINKM